MRAPFDLLVDVYAGPTTATPNALRFSSVPARLVNDAAFVDVYEPLITSIAYLTLDSIIPSGPDVSFSSAGIYVVDYGKCDRVALLPGGLPISIIARVETRTWVSGTNYFRCHLIDELSPLAFGGIELGGEVSAPGPDPAAIAAGIEFGGEVSAPGPDPDAIAAGIEFGGEVS